MFKKWRVSKSWEFYSVSIGFILLSSLFLPGSSYMWQQIDGYIFSSLYLLFGATWGNFTPYSLPLFSLFFIYALYGLKAKIEVKTLLMRAVTVFVFISLLDQIIGRTFSLFGLNFGSISAELYLVAFWIAKDFGKRAAWIALSIALFLCLPNLISAKVYFSDLLVANLGLFFLVVPLFNYIPLLQRSSYVKTHT